MSSALRYLLSTFDRRDRWLLWVYVLAQFVLATLDVVSVAAVYPLMQVVLDQPLDDGLLGTLHRLFGSPDRDHFVIALAGLMIVAFVLKAVFAALIGWWSSGLIARLQARTARRLLRRYLSEDYLTHRTRNTGELMRAVGSATQAAHQNVLGGILTALTLALSICFIGALLLVVAPVQTLVAAAYFGIVVYLVQRSLGPPNRRAGEAAQHASWISSHALVDAMHGYREAVLHNAQDFFVRRFDTANQQAVQAARWANFYNGVPKYLLELVTMVGLVLLIVIEVLAGNGTSAMPTLSLFVAATIKLLPLLVNFTATLGVIRVGQEGLLITADALRSASPDTVARDVSRPATLRSDASIALRDVAFRYPTGSKHVLRGITLDIPAGSSFAVCGTSGAGKTTLVDIILGLIPPTSGQVLYDGVPTAQAGEAWHDLVAYVPQDVYIADDTLAGNVAFGLPEAEQDRDRIRQSLSVARLDDLVDQLEDGIDTRVGERGSRLSGGQRQRLGIARALYREPTVLVLDEATSALDNQTEHEISETMRSLHGRITTILVAHRLSTVRHVDTLAFLDDGRVVASGTFEEVVAASPQFAHLVALGRLEPAGLPGGSP